MHVQLDDGDERDVPVHSVRLLPPSYPMVEGGAGEELLSPLGEVEGSTLTKLTVQVRSYCFGAGPASTHINLPDP